MSTVNNTTSAPSNTAPAHESLNDTSPLAKYMPSNTVSATATLKGTFPDKVSDFQATVTKQAQDKEAKHQQAMAANKVDYGAKDDQGNFVSFKDLDKMSAVGNSDNNTAANVQNSRPDDQLVAMQKPAQSSSAGSTLTAASQTESSSSQQEDPDNFYA